MGGHHFEEPVPTLTLSSGTPPGESKSVPPTGGKYLEDGSMLMHHCYASAWAGSLVGTWVRFIPVSPGSNRWILRRSTYAVACEFICNPAWASTRPTTWSRRAVLM